MKYRFFDLDGTLADTDPDIRVSWKAAINDLGLECPHFDDIFVAAPPIEEMVRRLFPDRYSEELADAIRTNFARHYDHDGCPNTFEYPGVLDAVRKLKERGDYVAIVTNKRYVGAKALAEKFGWSEIFDALYTGDMDVALGRENAVRLRKPQLLSRVIRELGAKSEDCTMIGDTINDFDAAKACSITSVGVTWGYGKESELVCADQVITRADELLALL